MHLFLVHHGAAVDPAEDARRPLSEQGRAEAGRLAEAAAGRGVRPDVIWHSGKLRARQTAEAFWRACNPLAAFSASRDLQPGDSPEWIRDRLRGETREVLIAGHFPHLPRLLELLLGPAARPEVFRREAAEPGPAGAGHDSGQGPGDRAREGFPLHGVVALASEDEGETWTELWRLPAATSRG